MARRYTLAPPWQASSRLDFSGRLNPQQLEAVRHPGGPALVIAGAGSGKTRTLTHRVAWLLEQGVRPRDILLLTFTNKAAREMLERVAELVPVSASAIWGGTFHSVGARLLRRFAERIGYARTFTILDREDAEDLISAAVASAGLATADRAFPKAAVLADVFSLAANTMRSIEETLRRHFPWHLPLAAQIEHAWAAYQLRKRQTQVMDFDDLLARLLELFEAAPDAEEECQFEHVLVDEYQDTNRLQSELAARLARRSGNLMVVGDDAQSIYSWRGADFANILAFPRRFPSAAIYRIETNYRSVPEILEVANAAIRANTRQFEKHLAPARTAGGVKPALVALDDNNEQAAFVAQRVLELHQEEGVPLNEIAVLYRAHFHSLEVQLEFTRRGIPFAITSGLRFFEQAHIKDAAAFLKFAVNPADELAFKRMAQLLPGVGPKSAEALWRGFCERWAQEKTFALLHELSAPRKAAPAWKQLVHTLEELRPAGAAAPKPAQMLHTVFFALYDDLLKQKYPNYEQRREDLMTLEAYAAQFENAEDFLAQLALLSSAEHAEAATSGAEEERVTLSTIHQAKGLEWSRVFIIWLTDDMFPNRRAAESTEGLEEERRLFYVAITRAKDELYLTYPELRMGGGFGDPLPRPSRFLREIPQELLEVWEVSGSPAVNQPF